MPLVGFETAIPASERPQSYPLDHAATQTGASIITLTEIVFYALITTLFHRNY